MAYIVDHLAKHGVRDIMVNTSHFDYRIEQYFGDGQRFGVNMGYSFEGHLDGDNTLVASPKGSAGALRHIQDFGGFFDDTTVVLCGDAIIDLDIAAAVAAHRKQGALATVIAAEVPRDLVSNYGVIDADASGRVRSFQEKPSPQEALSTWASTGIYIFEPEAINMIPRGQVFDIRGELFPLMASRGHGLFCQKHSFNWIDIGRVADYWAVVMNLMRNPVAGVRIPGREVRPGIYCGLNTRVAWDEVSISGPVHIGAGATVEAECEIQGPAWIGNSCHIERNARLSHSVLLEYAHVSPGAAVSDLIVSGTFCVNQAGQTMRLIDVARPWNWGDARRLRAQSVANGVAS